jgi:hypothetical protein
MEIYTNSLFWSIGTCWIPVSRHRILLSSLCGIHVSKCVGDTIVLLIRSAFSRNMTLGLRLSLSDGVRKGGGPNPHRILSQTWVQPWKRSPHKNPRALNGRPRGVHLYFYSGLSLSCCGHSFLAS